MTDNAELEQTSAPGETPTGASGQFWARVKEHKIIQWGLAYLGAALALAHGQHLLAEEFHWPDVLGRIFMGELTIISLLVVIAAVFFIAAMPRDEHAAEAAPAPPRGPPADVVPSATGAAARANRATALPTTLAVLPFENQNPQPDNAHFASGIHEQ